MADSRVWRRACLVEGCGFVTTDGGERSSHRRSTGHNAWDVTVAADAPAPAPAPVPEPASTPATIPAHVRAECAAIARDLVAELLDTPLAPPPMVATLSTTCASNGRLYARRAKVADDAAEYEWLHELSGAERGRLARGGYVSEQGEPADALADRLAERYGLAGESVDVVMAEWLRRTRRADAASVLSHGNRPSPRAYGGYTAEELLPELFDSSPCWLDEVAAVAERVPEAERLTVLDLIRGLLPEPPMVEAF